MSLPRLILQSLFVFAALSARAQQVDLPDGPGKDVVQKMCTQCHSVSSVTGQRMTRQQWSDKVDEMVSRGARGSASDIRTVVDYLATHYPNLQVPTKAAPQQGTPETGVDTPADDPSESHPEPTEKPGVFVSHESDEKLAGITSQRLLHADNEPQNWLTFNGTYRSNHYSKLSQVNTETAKRLELKWVFQARWLDPYEATPIVADGVMYTTQGNDVVALDAETGRMYWIYRYTPSSGGRLCCGRITRGLAIHGNTVYLAAIDSHLIALDTRTGNPLWDTHVARVEAGYSMTGAPLVVKDHIIVGVAGGEYGIRGFLASYNVYSGKLEWKFYATAGPGDPGRDTWGGDSYKRGGGSVWLTGSYDTDTNLLIWGVGNAGPDYNGDVRPGDNLYTSSMIALDADTGKLKWHYQANPHNEFDWDAVQTPLLVDMMWKGKQRKVLLWANRNGFFYVLDRRTGKFLLGTNFVKQNWNAGFDENGRPIMAPNTKSSETGTLIFPDNQGGTNWYGTSYSPRTGFFYVSARDGYSTLFLKGHMKFAEGQSYNGRGRLPNGTQQPVPAVGSEEENVLAIRALDPGTGERKWQYVMNSGLSLNPFGGWQTNAGVSGILTTAGDVLFVGGREGNLVVLDSRNGKKLWERQMGAQMLMDPMTYSAAGKQYFAITAGTALYVFGLREGEGK